MSVVPTQTQRTLSTQRASSQRPTADHSKHIAIEWLNPLDLKLNDYNVNQMDASTYETTARSILEHGWTTPIIIDPHGVVIDGAHRTHIARNEGMDRVPCVRVNIDDPAEKRIASLRHNIHGANNPDAERALHIEIARLLPDGLAGLSSALLTIDSDTIDSIAAGLELPTCNLPIYERDALPRAQRHGHRILNYYGGKDTMATLIAGQIPEHVCYAEPFAGSLAVLFAMEHSEVEVISDTNTNLVAFYKEYKMNYEKLKERIELTLCARSEFEHAQAILRDTNASQHDIAWAVFVCRNMSHLGLTDTMSIRTRSSSAKYFNHWIKYFAEMPGRLRHCTIERGDALRTIQRYDRADTFFYCDPPYINTQTRATDQGDYSGYTEQDYIDLLDALAGIQGKFILSSYDNAPLADAITSNGWSGIGIHSMAHSTAKDAGVSAAHRVELLIANFNMTIPAEARIDEVQRK